MDENNNILIKMYENSIEEFQKNCFHPHPANLLSILLLAEKDKFKPLQVDEGTFYKTYKSEIDSKIAKIIIDFKISKKEIEAFIEHSGILCNDFDLI